MLGTFNFVSKLNFLIAKERYHKLILSGVDVLYIFKIRDEPLKCLKEL